MNGVVYHMFVDINCYTCQFLFFVCALVKK